MAASALCEDYLDKGPQSGMIGEKRKRKRVGLKSQAYAIVYKVSLFVWYGVCS